LNHHIQYFSNLHACILHLLAQRHAINELCGNKVKGTFLTDFMDGEDVWMIEG